MRKLGIDIGSMYLGAVLLDTERGVLHCSYGEHKGNILESFEAVLTDSRFNEFDTIGITGHLRPHQGLVFDTILSLARGIQYLVPGNSNTVSIGGESFCLILFDEHGTYKEHILNPPCAAGTGSFLQQQAERLGLSISQFAETAREFTGRAPSIATRCSVFAKTDIIHAMQEGYSRDSVSAGLCEGIARNIIDSLIKGRELHPPLALTGGVALNKKVTASLSSLSGVEITVPEHAHLAGAIGAALIGSAESCTPSSLIDEEKQHRRVRPVITMNGSHYPDFASVFFNDEDGVEIMTSREQIYELTDLYLGIDIGSTSTKAALITGTGDFVAGFYTATGGKPVDATASILNTARKTLNTGVLQAAAVAVTGSGRKMIGELFSADLVIDEITAHARAAVFLEPKADTIIEIGGQDSKFTRIRNGNVYYSTMNYVCAAGTGSFIEEQAKKLGVPLSEFSDLAMGSESPYLSDRCTVYMERDLGVLLGEGWKRSGLAASTLFSVRDNYLSKVVGKSPLGDYIVFQGATARNKALIACFEELLQKPIHVSEYCHLTGAIGAALLAVDKKITRSVFSFSLSAHASREETCAVCSNNCRLTVIEADGKTAGWGMKCGSDYESRKPRKKVISAPEKRYRRAMAHMYETPGDPGGNGITVAVPDFLYNSGYAPLWYSLFTRIGCRVVLPKPGRNLMDQGKKLVNSDFCAPMIYAHGMTEQLFAEKPDFLFSPVVINDNNPGQEEFLFKKKTEDAYFCYYSQYLPTITEHCTSLSGKGNIASPVIMFNEMSLQEVGNAIFSGTERFIPGLVLRDVHTALEQAYLDYQNCLDTWKESAEAAGNPSGEPEIVILGRPYVMFNPAMNLSIPEKFESLGAGVYWMEELDLAGFQPAFSAQFLSRMHWHYGKAILKAAEYAAQKDTMFPVFLTCFRCSPDAFLLSYVKDILEHYDKPFLVLQLDEHSSDVGYETRIEAGLHSFRNFIRDHGDERKTEAPSRVKDDPLLEGDTVLIPYMDGLISRFWAACFNKAGYSSVLLNADEVSLNTGYRFASGGECMPLVSIAGGVIEAMKDKNLVPEKTYLYLPTLCLACNFPQFPVFSAMAFRNAGLEKLKIGLVNIMSPGDVLPHILSFRILESNILGSLLYKLYFRVKPYEIEAGGTDRVFKQSTGKILSGISGGEDLKKILKDIVADFSSIERDESGGRKPRLGLLGDLYVKFNEVVNQNLVGVVDELGGELIVPSLTEYPFHFYDADVRIHNDNPRPYRLLKVIEERYEKITEDLLDGLLEPDFKECLTLLEEYGIRHYIAGETSINLGRALYWIKNGLVDAIIHVNPMFCCPGVVSASVFRKIQEDFRVPIIDIFYDGTGDRNRVLVPHTHFLRAAREH